MENPVISWLQNSEVISMELRQLRYFLSVADTRSFVSAANKLFISRQAISKAISQLESELHVELFMRDSNGAFLTPAGVLFYERVRVLVAEADNLCTDMQRYGTRFNQHIRLAFSIGVTALFEPKLLEYRSTQMNLDIQYQECPEDVCVQLLQEHKVDMIVTPMVSKDPMLICSRLIESPLGILLQWNHALSELTEVEMSDLSWIPLAIHTDHFSQELCQSYALRVQYQGYDFQRLFSLVKDGLCGLILPQCFAQSLPGGVKWVPIVDVPPWTLYKTYPKTAERNQLYSAALDELHLNIFRDINQNEVIENA